MGVWTIVSILALAAAGVMLLRGEYNAAFVAAALGAVAWFLNYRALIRPTLPADDEADEDEQEDEEDDAAEDEPDASRDEDEK